MPNQTVVRKMHSGYYDALVSIDRECGEYFWNSTDFRKHIARSNGFGIVLLQKTTPIAFLAYEFDKDAGEINILNMGVRKFARRRGIGKLMLAQLKDKLVKRYKTLRMVVRDSNLISHLFLKNQGFIAHYEKNYFVDHYSDRTEREDGYCFEFKTTASDRSDKLESVC